MTNDDSAITMDAPFIAVLLLDVDTVISRRDTSDSATHRRELIRTAFAAIEGVIWVYRNHVAAVARDLEALEPGEQMALAERSYTVTEQGKVFEQQRYLSMTATFRLISRIVSRLSETADRSFEGTEWNDFRKALKVRHRITHPKSENDLVIANGDIEAALCAFYWVLDVTLQDIQAVNIAYREWVEQMRRILDALKRGDADTLNAYRQLRAEFS